MALLHCHFFSHILGLCSAVDVILPDPKPGKDNLPLPTEGRKFPTLYLLHGMSDDHTIWQRRTSIERYVDPLGLAVVMPAVQRSFYTDMAHGYRFGTYIAEELPALMRAWFPLSAAREDNFVAGLSMGGYGAFKLALTYPDRYGAAASLSGALDMAAATRERDPAWLAEMRLIFGKLKDLPGSAHDLFHLARQVAGSTWAGLPLYQWCGQQDFLYQGNLNFRDHAAELGLALTYEDGPGEHEWDAWDRQIQRVLAWLPMERPAPPSLQPPAPVVEKKANKKSKNGKKRKED